MRRPSVLVIAAAAFGLSGCVTIDNTSAGAIATAALVRSDGAPAGTARLSRGGGTLVLAVDTAGLSPGAHGMHIHAVGRCDRPDFASAGGHWNPSARAHGSANPRGAHAGDLPNLQVGPDGRGAAQFRIDPTSAGPGLAALFDADGAAVVVHAAPDDYRTDPSGNSGARIACGVLVRG